MKTPAEKKSKKRMPALGPESQKTIKMTGFFFDGSEPCAEVGEKIVYSRDPNSFAIS